MKRGAAASAPGQPAPPLVSLFTALRTRLRRVVLVLAGAWLLAFFFAQELAGVLTRPLNAAWERHRDVVGNLPSLHFKGLVDPFWASMSLAFWFGLILASPYLFHQLWRGVTRVRAPASRRYALP